MKILFIFITFCISLIADVKFTETKYLSALDMETTKHGSMHVDKNIFAITYTKPKNEIITYLENKLTFQNEKNEIKEFTYEKYPKIQYFGLLLKSIINDSYENLDNMFVIKDEKDKKILSAKSSISGTVDYLEVLKKDNKLSQIIFYMINKDKITIETVN